MDALKEVKADLRVRFNNNDKEVVIEAVKIYGNALGSASENLKNNKEVENLIYFLIDSQSCLPSKISKSLCESRFKIPIDSR